MTSPFLRTASCRTMCTSWSKVRPLDPTANGSSFAPSSIPATTIRSSSAEGCGSDGFEHVLRDEETTRAVARYTLANPVRAGLAQRVSDYPFAGSLVYDLEDLIGI